MLEAYYFTDIAKMISGQPVGEAPIAEAEPTEEIQADGDLAPAAQDEIAAQEAIEAPEETLMEADIIELEALPEEDVPIEEVPVEELPVVEEADGE